MMKLFAAFAFASFITIASTQKNPHYAPGRTTMVHLFEWKFDDIAKECEDFLGPMGYGGVQVSPVNEHLVIENRPWYERYQPISYKIVTRSGDESKFKNMIKKCNKAGVRIYVDAVFNHMTANIEHAFGTGGTPARPKIFEYPGVPYSYQDFHTPCELLDYNDTVQMRNCELLGLHDLDQSQEHVRGKIIDFLNGIVDLGVAGYRVDAAKHMWPQDLEIIYNRMKNLSIAAGFPENARPYIYQEVIDIGGQAIEKYSYNNLAAVIEFQYGIVLGNMFRGQDNLSRLRNFGNPDIWRMLPSEDALVMIDNHDNQRGHGVGESIVLTHKTPKKYKMAVAFMLAFPYGFPRVMSSFAFDDPNQGPPADLNWNTISPEIVDGQCVNGWVCEHRWPQIYRMVQFRNLANDEKLQNWWSNGKNQIAFSRGAKGFVAFNVEGDLRQRLQTGLPSNIYCDIITGDVINGECSGKSVLVDQNGMATIEILSHESEGVLALHVGAIITKDKKEIYI